MSVALAGAAKSRLNLAIVTDLNSCGEITGQKQALSLETYDHESPSHASITPLNCSHQQKGASPICHTRTSTASGQPPTPNHGTGASGRASRCERVSAVCRGGPRSTPCTPHATPAVASGVSTDTMWRTHGVERAGRSDVSTLWEGWCGTHHVDDPASGATS